MSLLAGIGLLVTCFGGMAAIEGQELTALAIISAGMAMTVAAALLHDRILTRKGLLADTVAVDEEDEEERLKTA